LAGNPFFGTGFESFWLGKRLETMWAYNRDIHQAHNGYLETYLNLGWVGLALLAAVLATGYRRVVNGVRRHQEAGSLWLALFVVAIIYNFTEAAFGMMSLVWLFLLLAIMSLSRPAAAALRVPAYSESTMPIGPLSTEGGSINSASEELAGLCANFELKDEYLQDSEETEQTLPFRASLN
jgi:O-antigen ligase